MTGTENVIAACRKHGVRKLVYTSTPSVVHSGAPLVRQDAALRDATLVVLGRMIDAGSSRAYRMRDDFLTPVRAHAAEPSKG